MYITKYCPSCVYFLLLEFAFIDGYLKKGSLLHKSLSRKKMARTCRVHVYAYQQGSSTADVIDVLLNNLLGHVWIICNLNAAHLKTFAQADSGESRALDFARKKTTSCEFARKYSAQINIVFFLGASFLVLYFIDYPWCRREI